MIKQKKEKLIAFVGLALHLLCIGALLSSGKTIEERVDLPQELFHQKRAFPIIMDSAGQIGIGKAEDKKVFVFQNQVDIRQGDLRIVADNAVVWVENVSDLNTKVRIYAEGSGPRGEAAKKPVFMQINDQKKEAAALHLSMETLVGVAWECQSDDIEDIQSVRIYERASIISEEKGRQKSYTLNCLPQVTLTPREAPEPSIDMLRADVVRIFTREEPGKMIVVYVGNVYGEYQNLDINADTAVLWIDSKEKEFEIYAQGDILLRTNQHGRNVLGRQGLETLRADRLYINPSKQRGLVYGAELRLRDDLRDEIYVVRGEEAYILDRENLLLKNAGTTNCLLAVPHYEFQAGTMRFIQRPSRLFASGWNVGLVVGENQRRLFWLPYLGMNLDDQTFLLRGLSGGKSSDFGTTVETQWAPSDLGLDPDWLDEWEASVDYYSKRGTGLGSDVNYSFGDKKDVGIYNSGRLKGYYIADRADEDSTGFEVPQTDRSHLQFQHRVNWNPRWRTDLEFHHVSDHAFMREYFRNKFVSEKAPETQAFTRYSDDHLWAGIQLKNRQNSFMTQREALPGIEMNLLNKPLGPFSYDAAFDAGLYDYKYSSMRDRSDPPEITRLHTDHKMSFPFRIGFLQLDPYARALATYASNGAEINDTGDFRSDRSRAGGGGGLRIATDLSRTYNVRREMTDLSRMRHIVTPYVEAETLEVDEKASEFIQMRGDDPWPRYGRGQREREDWIDSINDRDVLKLGLRQRLQTKRDGRSVDWMRLDVEGVFRSEDVIEEEDVLDDDFLVAHFEWKLTPKLSLTSEDNRMSFNDDVEDVVNFGMRWEPVPRLDTSARYSRIEGRSSSVIAHMNVELSDRYSLSVHERYEFDRRGTGRGQNMQTDVILSRWFHKWLLQMEFYYDGTGDGDKGFFLRLSPSFLEPMGRREGIAVW